MSLYNLLIYRILFRGVTKIFYRANLDFPYEPLIFAENQSFQPMKTVTKILALLILLLFPFQEITADDDTPSDDENDKTEILVPTPPPGKPRMPSRIFIECRYSVGHISFAVPSDVLFLEVSLNKNETTLWEGIVTRDNPKTIIPVLPSGEYTIVCRTDGNQIFHGTLTY